METTVLCYNRVNIGDVLGLYRGYIGDILGYWKIRWKLLLRVQGLGQGALQKSGRQYCMLKLKPHDAT